jgi:hypothetical protein
LPIQEIESDRATEAYLNLVSPNSREVMLKSFIEKPGISILIAGFKVITLFLTDDFQLSQT